MLEKGMCVDSLSGASLRLSQPRDDTRAILNRPKKWYNRAARLRPG
jgi:hypothetical protein